MWAGDQPWQPALLDVGHDDYYGHGRADCLDLARRPYLTSSAQLTQFGDAGSERSSVFQTGPGR
jgi:hypothetical protein